MGVLGASLLLLLTSSCASSEATEVVSGHPVEGLTATLEDEVRDLPGGRIAWSTYWELCWEPYPGAKAYELKTLTGEGEVSGELRRQEGNCFRIEVAAGENEKSEGLETRDVQLALQQGQLAYRVRAVLGGGRVSKWSKAAPVGKKLGERSAPPSPATPGSAASRAEPLAGPTPPANRTVTEVALARTEELVARLVPRLAPTTVSAVVVLPAKAACAFFDSTVSA
jgi:hypothetical protein